MSGEIPDRSDPARLAALAIIEQGRRNLTARPRADMPGFRLVSETEIRQQAKYDRLRNAEAKSREADRAQPEALHGAVMCPHGATQRVLAGW